MTSSPYATAELPPPFSMAYPSNVNYQYGFMLNYIISYLTGFFINDRFADSLTRSMKICSDSARLSWTDVQIAGMKCSIPLGIVLALAAAFVVKFIFDKTVFGFELRAVGRNPVCARYTGIKVGRRIVVALMLSGMDRFISIPSPPACGRGDAWPREEAMLCTAARWLRLLHPAAFKTAAGRH